MAGVAEKIHLSPSFPQRAQANRFYDDQQCGIRYEELEKSRGVGFARRS